MIKYQLICDEEHEFEGWFGDSSAFEAQQQSGLLSCPVCGCGAVRRALMAPNLGEVEPEGFYGHATTEEREALDEEGIDVLDMPWLPKDN